MLVSQRFLLGRYLAKTHPPCQALLYRGGFFDFCRGRVVVVDHASGIFACRAYGLPPLEADLVILGLALLIEMEFSIFAVVGWSLWSCILVTSSRGGFFDFCRGRVVVLVDHASGIFACRAYGLPPLEADLACDSPAA